ncbi:hypothetical protein [Alteromonas sp. S167]|uniref:hypothetical protein n=1 Tax=Alteromonas sp. S167 TaxID=3117402 RepID=UPI002FE3A3A5
MTAEIAVLNKSAVALAADSAVTISNGNGNTKIYNGAEKLFALTKYHPVGIMVYGSGSLCRVPWELVIKEYRKRLGKSSFSTLDAYTEDFFKFLEQEEHLIPRDLRDHFLINHWISIYSDIWDGVREKAEVYVEQNDAVPPDDVTYEFLNNICDNFIDLLERENFLQEFSQTDVDELAVQTGDFVNSQLTEQNIDQDSVPNHIKSKIAVLLALATAKENPLGSNSGVVFAGYGDQEFFPSVLTFNLKGFWGQKLRRAPNPQKSAGGGESGIEAYAQDEEALTFMRGISPAIQSHYTNIYFDAMDKIIKKAFEIIDKNDDDLKREKEKSELLEAASQEWSQANSVVNQIIQNDYVDQVVNMVEFLPKDELAYMAESLVNMTAFKRKVTNDSETVGGPIDVAVISKGDGFVWIKRKHYFESSLNSHYFEKFSKGQ